jgi:hypothetical protein
MQARLTSRLPSTATQYLLVGTDGVRVSTLEVRVRSLAILFRQTTSRVTRITTIHREVMANHQLNSHLQDLMVRMIRVVPMAKVRQKVVGGSGAAAGIQDGNCWYRCLSSK